ncbi:hypothetical protein [Roseofilum capinflatum]|uniref:Transmembrane protein n=1 Tax=Roseofilum capinflatum BLCC-M114 TaxID=3022440 RepID=A0ABT7BA68_9CYAN|nr:hypothetical protein [Roseofilum capinflatum]MDJ1176083.1 hypothetical protein [Roseofilum capinflatum BLCC-M114]
MIKLPPELAVVIFTFGAAMLLGCIVGKVSIKGIEFGAKDRLARFLLGIFGTMFVVLSIISFINI